MPRLPSTRSGTRPGAEPDERERREPGRTRAAQGETQQPVPQEPFERDESVEPGGQGAPSTPRIGQLAQAAAEHGIPDTTRGAEMDATYHRLRQEAEAPRGQQEGGPKDSARDTARDGAAGVRPSRGPRASRR